MRTYSFGGCSWSAILPAEGTRSPSHRFVQVHPGYELRCARYALDDGYGNYYCPWGTNPGNYAITQPRTIAGMIDRFKPSRNQGRLRAATAVWVPINHVYGVPDAPTVAWPIDPKTAPCLLQLAYQTRSQEEGATIRSVRRGRLPGAGCTHAGASLGKAPPGGSYTKNR